MQKKLLVLALAGFAVTPAFADDNVTIYGRIDTGFLSRSGGDGGVADQGTKNEIASGIAGGSRIGFRGTEDLGNGLKAIFELEYGIATDSGSFSKTAPGATGNGNATWQNRHSYVGLTGDFGTFLGGRIDGARYGILTRYDPFASGTVANAAGITGQATRADNAIAYVSPRWNGFGFLAAYTNQLIGQENSPNNTGDTRLYALAGFYDNGPISLTLDYERAKDHNIPGNSDVKVWVLGGSYDFGAAKLAAYWDNVKTDGTITQSVLGYPLAGIEVDKNDWMLGVTVPVGKLAVKASYVKVNDKTSTNADCDKTGIGLQYNLSKRTNLYTDYARIKNDNGAACSIGTSGSTGSFDSGAVLQPYGGGYGVRGFDMGIAHTF